MIINEIKRKGKSDKYYLITNNGKFLVKDETIYLNKIKCGEIEDELFFKILQSTQNLLAFDEIINIVSKTYKTKKEIYILLKNKGYIDESIFNAIEKAESYHYIDDDRYTQMYIDTYSKSKGKIFIKNSLLQKGIDENIIIRHLNEFEDDRETILKLAIKYYKGKSNQKNIREKLFRFLVSKGFNFELIKSVVNEVVKDIDNENW